MGFLALLIVYILGGITFLPLLLCAILLHAYLTSPQRTEPLSSPNEIPDPSDDGKNIKSKAALADLGERFRRGHEPDVAAGYFAVCREYVPGGVNGKPPERTTPAGTTVVAPESPSVYQSMYRSIFDRKQGPTLEPGKGNGKPAKRARNVFFVVLRHGHLMLYDDSEQLDPRHVIFLEHHDVSIYGGEDEILEGELFIKRNSIRLARKPGIEDPLSTSKPFYFFSENCSDKEDFYFALLHNQEAKSEAANGLPRPQYYDVKNIITLVQKLHSSEEQMHTRWLNALIGRLFLAIYKTQEVEDMLRKKITKKIARVKKPAFLSGIILRKVELGEGAPYITNPRLKDLTVDGDCCVEADVKYSGGFRLEVAATARIDLGARFKAREVNLVLAVVIRRLEGHILVKFKPPPSNRIWISFESMPLIDMNIEPIVSSRQITYTVILRAIESRIREVIAETIVLPHWDDSPFTDTTNQPYRGGIWAKSTDNQAPAHTTVPDDVVEDEAEPDAMTVAPALSPQSKEDRTMSLPVLLDSAETPGKAMAGPQTLLDGADDAISSGVEKKQPEPPKAIRSRSFASVADPLLSMDNANIESRQNDNLETSKKDRKYSDATSAMMAISQRSPPISPTETPMGSLQDRPTFWESSQTHKSKPNSVSSTSSKPSSIPERAATLSSQSTPTEVSASHSRTNTRTSISSREAMSKTKHETNSSMTSIGADTRSTAPSAEKKYSTASLGAATAAAKKWGWSVLTRNADSAAQPEHSANLDRAGTPERPIGRGHPLPPPGQPLPFPEHKSQFSLPKRKPIPAPLQQTKSHSDKAPALPRRTNDETLSRNDDAPPPALPRRRRQGSKVETEADGEKDGMLVVEAPVGSEPSSPLVDRGQGFTGSSGTESNSQRSFIAPEDGDITVA